MLIAILKKIIKPKWLMLALSLSIMTNALYLIGNKADIFISTIIKNQALSSTEELGLGLQMLFEVMVAYLLFISALALQSRARVIWLILVAGLLYLSINSLFTPHPLHNGAPAFISLILLVLVYKYFDKPLYLSYGFVFISAFIIFALFYGTFGCYFLRSEFHGLNSITDRLYFTIATYSTVGYGDIYPITNTSKLFVISMIIIGLLMFTSGITLIAYTLNHKLKNMLFNFNKGRTAMNNHIVFYGYGVLAKILIHRYQKHNEKFLVICNINDNDQTLTQLREENLVLQSPYPGCSDTLARARVNEAKLIIISFENDADTVFATLNVCEYLAQFPTRPKIIARIFYEENIQKAIKAGADHVIAPHILAADTIDKIEF